jgi:phosphoribosyl-ATP pyrophosphohydrolase/phosphoribosyl-AMP cyclohydrolase
MDTTKIKWDDKGLIPAIIQDSISFNVLMLGYMNKESLDLTLSSKELNFFSRSRDSLFIYPRIKTLNDIES